ncbi:MAG: hypothetical protein V4739_03565 [Pseudomonadota bacterium]
MPNPSIARSSRPMGAALTLWAVLAAPAFAGGEPPFTQMGDLLDLRPVQGQRADGVAAPEVGAPELWGRLFELLRESPGGLSKARFEGTFGAPMRESLIGGDAAYYAVNAGQSGRYFDVGLSAYDRRAKANVRSRTARAVDGQKGCVAPMAAVQDLMGLGWVPGQYDRQGGNFYSFARRQGQDQIFLYAAQGCVHRVNISLGA